MTHQTTNVPDDPMRPTFEEALKVAIAIADARPSDFGKPWAEQSKMERARRVIEAIEAFAAIPQSWLDRTLATIKPQPSSLAMSPLETAPKDGTLVCLLVDYTDGHHPLDDTDLTWTIGFNNLEHDDVDQWKFVGWSWQQDHFTEGEGKPIAWAPWTVPLVPRDLPADSEASK